MRRLPIVAARESRSAVLEPLPPIPADFGLQEFPPLRDAQGRAISYLRLSVTDRCDLACLYCMPPQGEGEHGLREELLSFDEAARVVGVFAASGVRRVRLTGGEPLVRKDVVRLVSYVRERTPVDAVVMTTNATRLPELAEPLFRAGLSGVNVSLDSLDPDRFRRLTRGGELGRVLAGIHAALGAGLSVKLNTVLMGGENDAELGRIVDFAWEHGITPRLIELMPIGEGAKLPREAFLSAAVAIECLGERLRAGGTAVAEPGRGPATYLEAADGTGRRVGFITAVTETFCDSCNRVRMTARGDIRACLAHRRAVSLRDLVRSGATDRELAWAMHWALSGKLSGHFFDDPRVAEHARVGMSLIGG